VRLDARNGWRGVSTDGAVIAGDRLALVPLPGEEAPLVDDAGSFGGFSEATGIAVAADGTVYVLDAVASRIRRYDPCRERFDTLPCIGGAGSEPRRLRDPRGLATTRRGDLVVADTGNRRLQIFTQKGLALRAIVELAWNGARYGREGTAWEPYDAIEGPSGDLYVTDRTNGFVLRLDRALRVREVLPDTPLVRPTHVAADCGGAIFVVEDGTRIVRIARDDDGSLEVEPVAAPADLGAGFRPIAVAVDPAGNLYLTEAATGRVYVLNAGSGAGAGPLPSRAYEDGGSAIGFTPEGDPLVGGDRVVRLRAHGSYPPSGAFETGAIDSRLPGCAWHRIVIEGEVPELTRIVVYTFTSEVEREPAMLPPTTAWQTAIARTASEGAWSCLVMSPRGRYLYLRLTLESDGRSTPAIDAIRIEYPRETSARFLPAIYRADSASGDFTERFLALFDALRDPVRDTLDGFTRWLDADGAPALEGGTPDYLAWLSSWLGLATTGSFTIAQRRALLREAPRLYGLRGTPEGLREHVRLYTGFSPTIVEHFKVRGWAVLGATSLGANTSLYGAGLDEGLRLDEFSEIGRFVLRARDETAFDHHAHRFTLVVPVRRRWTDSERSTLEAIVELAKPAHTEGTIVLAFARMRVGKQARVGIDSIVGGYPTEGVALSDARLDRSAVLSPSEDESNPPAMRIGTRSRIGTNTIIDA
jgi:phage tail-like protein